MVANEFNATAVSISVEISDGFIQTNYRRYDDWPLWRKCSISKLALVLENPIDCSISSSVFPVGRNNLLRLYCRFMFPGSNQQLQVSSIVHHQPTNSGPSISRVLGQRIGSINADTLSRIANGNDGNIYQLKEVCTRTTAFKKLILNLTMAIFSNHCHSHLLREG